MSNDSFPLAGSNSPEEHQEPDRPYHSKRPHKKSRKGCVNCKTRKVKCDEARPTCKSCRLRKVECVYNTPAAAPQPAKPSPRAPIVVPQTAPSPETTPPTTKTSYSSSTSSGSSPEDTLFISNTTDLDFDFNLPDIDVQLPTALPPDPLQLQLPPLVPNPTYRPKASFDDVDMKLLWFYTTNTCSSFAVNDGRHKLRVEDTFRSTVVRYAFQSPFLMDSIFALACLHMEMYDKTLDQRRLMGYRARAFEGYRQAIEAADPDTFPALMANSIILCGVSSQTFREAGSKSLYIVDWMVVWKGIGLMIDFISLDRLFTSGLSSVFFRPAIDLDRSARFIPNNLLFMVSSIASDDRDHDSIQIYYTSLKYLGSLYLALQAGFGPILNLRIVTWFTFVPAPFVTLCQEYRPRALVILAYYASFLRLLQDIWWLEGVGERSIQDIVSHLGPRWSDSLRIPIAILKDSDRVSMARTILEDPIWIPRERPANQTEVMDADTRRLMWVNEEGKVTDEHGRLTPGQQAIRRVGMSDDEIYAPFSPQFKEQIEDCERHGRISMHTVHSHSSPPEDQIQACTRDTDMSERR